MQTITLTNEELLTTYRSETNEIRKTFLKEEFFKTNFNLIHYVSNRYRFTGYEYEELVGVASIGMVNAFDKFKLEKGAIFSTYAVTCMENEIKAYLDKNSKFQNELQLTEQGEDGSTIIDIIPDENIQYEKELEIRDSARTLLEDAKHILDETEYAIVLNFLNEEPKTQRELSEQLGTKQQYISKFISTAKRKLLNHARQNKITYR